MVMWSSLSIMGRQHDAITIIPERLVRLEKNIFGGRIKDFNCRILTLLLEQRSLSSNPALLHPMIRT